MNTPTPEPFGDPLTAPFWQAAARHELVLQRCAVCGTHQFYPRPFCLSCDSESLAWVATTGLGTIHSVTRVWRQAFPEHPVPYLNALVDLDEGPRLLTIIEADTAAIGDRVRVAWRERENAPPLPVFRPISMERG